MKSTAVRRRSASASCRPPIHDSQNNPLVEDTAGGALRDQTVAAYRRSAERSAAALGKTFYHGAKVSTLDPVAVFSVPYHSIGHEKSRNR
jgi:hypothetical protein